jgi:hypothetical protein
MRIRSEQLHGAVFLLVMMLPPMTAFGADTRHSGTVLEVRRGALIVDELGRAGTEHKLMFVVTPKTRIVDSQRNPHMPTAQASFTEHNIALSDIRKGDFVVVEITPDGTRLEAQSVMVTLRGSGK